MWWRLVQQQCVERIIETNEIIKIMKITMKMQIIFVSTIAVVGNFIRDFFSSILLFLFFLCFSIVCS